MVDEIAPALALAGIDALNLEQAVLAGVVRVRQPQRPFVYNTHAMSAARPWKQLSHKLGGSAYCFWDVAALGTEAACWRSRGGRLKRVR